MDMIGEITNFLIVWLLVFSSLCLCYLIGKKTSKGITRFLCVLPFVCLFLYLPLTLDSPNTGGPTAFFIAWLGTFKLILFAFGQGPLCSNPSISLKHFVAAASLPIEIQETQDPISKDKQPKKQQRQELLVYATKGLVVALMFNLCDYGDLYIHSKFRLFLYCFQLYFLLEILLAAMATIVKATLGVKIEPQFNKPYVSTSLQDFWGRRWNLMVTRILRPSVYIPITNATSRILGHNFASLLGIFCTFFVSGIMHELMFYYLGGSIPTGEITCFFVLHGTCVVLEVILKKLFKDMISLPWLISGPLTLAFVLFTGFHMFIPHFTKAKIDVKAIEEYAAFGALVKNVTVRLHQFSLGITNFLFGQF